jgi:hypothetical protein
MNLTKQEIQGLMQLLDIATKAGGINVAESAVYFAKKLEAYQKSLDAPKAEPKKEEPKPKK